MFKKFRYLDIVLLVTPILLVVLSVALIYSLVFSGDDSLLALRQGIYGVVGIVSMILVILIDYRSFRGLWWVFYLLAIVLLIIVDLFGQVSGGAMRWINLGFFQLQPSEVAKIAIIITMASFFSAKVSTLRLRDFIWSAVLFAIPFGLILTEPDLGTAMVMVFVYLVMLLSAKPNKKQFVALLLVILILVSVFVLSVFNIKPFGSMLKPYQRSRVEVFLNPALDPFGQGYNVRQAQITLGSGGLLGRGLGRGSQSQLKFLPKPHTDFIFAGVGEAIGFAGSFLVVLLYGYFIIRILSVGSISSDNFGMLLALGIASMFLFQIVINIGMNLGLFPVTGIPLPFLSNGGTSLIISFISLGIIQNIFIRRKERSLRRESDN